MSAIARTEAKATFPPEPQLSDATLDAVAIAYDADPLDLRLRFLLHAPRLGPHASRTDHLHEAERLAAESHALAPPALRAPPAGVPSRVDDALFGDVGEDEARFVNERLHYLRSHRTDSKHYGLRTSSGDLFALASVSPTDDAQMEPLLPYDVGVDRTATVSRVFVQRWAPRNTISYLLSRVERVAAAAYYPPRLLLTFVNPNLGFRGASYRAANWSEIGTVPTHYSYVDGEYQSDRQLAARFGTADGLALRALLGERFQRVSDGLSPLLVFANGAAG